MGRHGQYCGDCTEMMSLKMFSNLSFGGVRKGGGVHISMPTTLVKEAKLDWLLRRLEATRLR